MLTLIIFLTSCSSVKKIETFFTPVEREPLNLKEPVLGKLESIKWIVITSENAEEVFKKLEEEGIDPVLFGLTDNDYQLIAKNFAQIRHNLKTRENNNMNTKLDKATCLKVFKSNIITINEINICEV